MYIIYYDLVRHEATRNALRVFDSYPCHDDKYMKPAKGSVKRFECDRP